MKKDNGEQRLSKWTEQLHDKLADYEVAPPEGLWEEIAPLCPPEAPLCPPEGGKVRRSRFVALRWWAVAAAVAVVAVLIAPLSPPEGGMSPMQITQRNRPPVQNEEPQEPEATPTQSAGRPVPMAMVSKTAIDSPSLLTMSQPEEEETTETETTPGESIVETEAATVEKEEPTVEKEVETESQTVVSELERQIAELPAVETTQRVSLGLYAIDGLSIKNSSNGVLMADAMAKQYHSVYENSYASAARSSEPIYLAGYEEKENHHRPISFGLTLDYPLTERLSLTTGVVYTKLVSDFTQVMRKTQIQRKQTLHYVGIPVGLNYRFWASKGFKAYGSAGALVYWNVKTHVVTEGVTQEMESDKLQLSLSGGLGVQYDIIPQLGLYVEPGLSYYPDNNSHIQNFFKDKPVNLSLQFGLRVNMQR